MTTRLSLAARNYVVQDPVLAALSILGKDEPPKPVVWPLWVWADEPQRRIENTQKCGIVFFEGSPWTSPNQHNTSYFPTLVMDIWADPTRNSNGSVRRRDAEDRIMTIFRVINRLLHTVNNAVPSDAPAWQGTPGLPRIWGQEDEIADRSGLTIISSMHASGPVFTDMANNDGGVMGRFVYNIEHP